MINNLKQTLRTNGLVKTSLNPPTRNKKRSITRSTNQNEFRGQNKKLLAEEKGCFNHIRDAIVHDVYAAWLLFDKLVVFIFFPGKIDR